MNGIEIAQAEYASLSERGQVALMARVARKALESFPIVPLTLRKLNHGFNTTFRVDTARGETFAVRVNVHSRVMAGTLEAEIAWVEALSTVPGIRVPTPLRTFDGDSHVEAESGSEGWRLPVVVYSWLPGRLIGLDAPLARYREIGEMVAKLHAHARAWSPPSGSRIREYTDPLLGEPWRMPKDSDFLEVHSRVEEALGRLRARPPMPIHYDLHLWNIMLYRGKVAIFDFDDMLNGWPALDASVASWYYRSGPDGRERELAFLDGMRFEEAAISAEDYEALIAGRQIQVLNDLLGVMTASVQAEAPKLQEVSRIRLANYLKTGIFDRSVASMK